MSNNQDVTLAVLDTKLDYIQKKVDNIDKRLDLELDGDNGLKKRVTLLESKTSNIAVFQAVLSIVSSSIAAFLGVRK